MLLQNRTAIVTGAGSGIGRAVAIAYAREGARVVVSDIAEEGGQETVRLVESAVSGAECVFVRADASSPEDHVALVQAAVDRFGALHVACNNAGIGSALAPVGETSVETWRRIIEVNLSGTFYAMHAQIPRMLDAGGGSIVNMASILAQVGLAGAASYTASKHGMLGLTRAAALEYAAKGVRVNAVGPGFIATPILLNLPEEARAGLAALHPVGRIGRPEEVAELVAWLSSDRASFVTGACYAIDGGYLAK